MMFPPDSPPAPAAAAAVCFPRTITTAVHNVLKTSDWVHAVIYDEGGAVQIPFSLHGYCLSMIKSTLIEVERLDQTS